MTYISRRSALSWSAGSGLLGLMGGGTRGYANTPAGYGNNSDLEMTRVPVVPFSPGGDGNGLRPVLADIGALQVPADHFKSNVSQPFRLRFCRFPARRPTGSPPIFCFFGGPDWRNDVYLAVESGVANDPKWQFIELVTQTTDLVLIDHRGGAGCLFPKLPPLGIHAVMPLDRPVPIEERRTLSMAANRKIVEVWGEAGIDLSLFNTPQLAQDVDAVRRSLGYDKIRLIADSNGTYRAREYLRQFSRNTASALLFISHAYRKSPDPRNVQKALNRIDAGVAKDVAINRYVTSVSDLLDDIMIELDRKHPKVTVEAKSGNDKGEIVLGAEDIVPYLWYRGGEEEAIRDLPGRLWRIKQGDYADIASISLYQRTRDGDMSACELAFSGTAMPTDYVEDRRSAGSRMYLNREMSDGPTSAWPLPHDSQTPFSHSVPITYVQGEWDIKTPVDAVADLKEPSAHIHVVRNMAHCCSIDGGWGGFWERDIVDAFLRGNPIPDIKPFSSSFNPHAFQA